MKTKTKIDIDLKTKKKKKANTSGSETRWYPINPTMLRILGSLTGRAAGVSKVNDIKAAQRQLEELKHHNRVIEGHGLYLAPYKS